MTPPLKPNDEAGRLKLLRQTEVLDTPPEVHFDNLTQLAAQTCEAPVALVSFVDADRVWFKSKLGTDAPQCTRDDSYCGHVVNERKLVLCLDTTADWRFSDSPFTRQAGFRFYMGHPIIPPGTRHVANVPVNHPGAPQSGSLLRGSNIRGARAVHARCVYWGDFVDLPTYWTVKCMCFQAVKGITIAHTALCPLTVSPM